MDEYNEWEKTGQCENLKKNYANTWANDRFNVNEKKAHTILGLLNENSKINTENSGCSIFR